MVENVEYDLHCDYAAAVVSEAPAVLAVLHGDFTCFKQSSIVHIPPDAFHDEFLPSAGHSLQIFMDLRLHQCVFAYYYQTVINAIAVPVSRFVKVVW